MKEENYRTFKQVVNSFYKKNTEGHETKEIVLDSQGNIKILPKLLYSKQNKNIKMEVFIGTEEMYKVKSLPEFFDRILAGEKFKYGPKLDFVHHRNAFAKEDRDLLEFILKYAEIIKYSNEASGNYGYFANTMNDGYITISNTGLDIIFNLLKGREISIDIDGKKSKVLFSEEDPEIRFGIEKINDDEYELKLLSDIKQYEILQGKKAVYLFADKVIYKCSKEYSDSVLMLFEIFKNNMVTEIPLGKKQLTQLFSIIVPKIKKYTEFEKLSEDEIEKYVPQDLAVKIFLDYDKTNNVTMDIKFCYGEQEFNPLLEENVPTARDVAKEDEILEAFRKTGFMYDADNNRLILVEEEAIYRFLSSEIESYMQKYEVLATETFKTKEVRAPKIGNLGVKTDNNLLSIDLSNLDFDLRELREIMSKYKMKKKFHRLKDGSFLNLANNETLSFLQGITDGVNIDYSEVEKGEIKLPMYRSMYIDRILKQMKDTRVTRDTGFRKIIGQVENKEFDTIDLPKSLKADLRTYQKVGFEWLKVLDSYGFGGILADDMGLGKTLQVIAVIQSYLEDNTGTKRTLTRKPSIVICPSSLSLNWQNEINKFAPSIKSMVIHGNIEERHTQLKKIPQFDVVITSYDLLKRDIDIYKELDYEFKYIVADEAQYIKNNNTQNAKAIKNIKAETRYALTGTPIENSLSELWSIFDFIMPGYLFTYRKFKDNYETPIVKGEDSDSMVKLKMLIEPFILRRIKKEVLTELPDKTITVLNNEMQDEQLKVYMSFLASAKKEAAQEIAINGVERSQIKILALLMRLRQICCHPGLFVDGYKNGSSKLTQCMEVIQDAVESGHKILLFSGYTGMFEIIEKELKEMGIKYFKLTGQTKVSERIKLVDEFNENNDIKIFLISLKAGGTGLNLIGADMVIHYDPWWNLSAENQATDRTYRIGQKKNVQVYKLITKNSIEEKIYSLQEKKAKLVDNMLSTNQTFINKLSKDEILELFEK